MRSGHKITSKPTRHKQVQSIENIQPDDRQTRQYTSIVSKSGLNANPLHAFGAFVSTPHGAKNDICAMFVTFPCPMHMYMLIGIVNYFGSTS